MIRPSLATDLSSVPTRPFASCALVLAAVAFTLAFCLPPQAHAQTHRSGSQTHSAGRHAHKARADSHSAGAKAHKAACSTTHTKRGSHTCSSFKGHKHGAKTGAHRRHATGSRHVPAQGKVQTPSGTSSGPSGPAPGGSSGATCSDGVNATLDEEGSFACANGAEPGCREGFAPVVSGDGSTLICEPELSETSGDEEG